MRLVLAFMFVAALATSVQAQQAEVDPMAAFAEFEAAQAAAETGAMRPGDEALTCEQLEAEFAVTMNDPAFRQATTDLGVWAQGQQARASQARGEAMRMMVTGVITGIASSFIPGAGYAQQAMMAGQARRMQQQAQQNQQEMMQQATRMRAIMPTAYRGKRLYELAQAKACAFLQTAPAP
jgi:hypothetical protein